MQLKNHDDTLEQSIQTFLMPWSAVVTDDQADSQAAREEAYTLMSQMFADVEGVTMVCQKQDDGILCIVNIDYGKADIASLKEAGLDSMTGLAEGYVSASRTLNLLEEQGYACEAGD